MKIRLLILYLLGMLVGSCAKQDASVESDLQGIPGSITRFAVFRNHLYGLNQNEVLTFDLANPDQPKLVHKLSTDYGLETITVYDSTIYLGSTTSLYILDISNPAEPKVLSQTPREFGFTGCDPVVVKDQFAYSTIKVIENICGSISAQSALVIYDVSDKTAPKQLGLYPMNLPNGLGIYGDYLMICDEGSDRVEVFDISDRANPQLTSYSIPLVDPVDLIVYGQKMIVSTKTSFEIYEIGDIANLRKVGSIGK